VSTEPRQIDLRGKTILVTGGSMGLGLASARACLQYGANVMVCARGGEALVEASAELTRSAPAERLATETADVGIEADVERLFDRIVASFGRCDGIIHAAAILGPVGTVDAVDDADAWLETLRINLFGTFLVARAGARRMKKSGGGRIVLYSGGGGATPRPNFTAYASSKAAVVRFAETIALELAPDVEVNALAPGFVVTRMQHQTIEAGERAGEAWAEEVRARVAEGGTPPSVAADAGAFLVSDAARGITGKLVAASFDKYREWPLHLAELRDGDLFTLRRILPRDRGLDWQ
jgi:NAD(P)-dependent dehydrogenase (short-subunit alcohol dehydrogenase family)